MADGEDLQIDETQSKAKNKRRLTPSKWKRNEIKVAKVKGEAHTSYGNKLKPSKEAFIVECRCKCLTKLTEDERKRIFTAFTSLKDHEAQNVYLCGCMRVNPDTVICQTPRKEDAKERSRRKTDRVILPSQWVSLIKRTDVLSPFDVVYIEHPLTDNMMDDGTPIVKVLDYKKAFDPLLKPITGISEFRVAKFERGKEPLSRNSMTSDCTDLVPTFKRGKKLSTLLTIKPNRAFVNFLAVKTAKVNDIKELLKHDNIPAEATFYYNIRGRDTVEDSSDTEVVEE